MKRTHSFESGQVDSCEMYSRDPPFEPLQQNHAKTAEWARRNKTTGSSGYDLFKFLQNLETTS